MCRDGLYAVTLSDGTVLNVNPAQAGYPAVAKGNGNPVTITRANYQDYMKELFSSPSGTYNLMFARYDEPTEDEPGVYPLNRNNAVEITTQTYGYDPILYAAYLKKADITTSEDTDNWPDFCIGYLAMENFDLGAQFTQPGINAWLYAQIPDADFRKSSWYRRGSGLDYKRLNRGITRDYKGSVATNFRPIWA